MAFGSWQFILGAAVWVIVFPLSMLMGFGIPTAITILAAGLLLRRVGRQWIHVAVIAGVAAVTALTLQLTLLEYDPGHQPTYFLVPVASAAAAALGRLAASPLMRMGGPAQTLPGRMM